MSALGLAVKRARCSAAWSPGRVDPDGKEHNRHPSQRNSWSDYDLDIIGNLGSMEEINVPGRLPEVLPQPWIQAY